MFFSLFTNKNKGAEFKRTPFFSPWDFQSVRPNSGIIVSTKSTRQTGVINVQYQQSQVQFEFPLNGNNLRQVSPDTVSFVNDKKTIEPQYQAIDNGVKENIILHQPPTTNQFPVTLKTTNADLYLTTENLPVFLDPKTKRYLLHVDKPFAVDAKGDKTYAVSYQLFINNQPVPELATASTGTYKLFGPLTKIGPQSSYQLVIKVDPQWLFNKSRSYPVTVDPTIIHNTQTQFATGTLERLKDTGTGDTAPNLETYYQELGNDQNTVGLWHFNETSGTTSADASGLGNTAVSIGTVNANTTTPRLGAASRVIGDISSYMVVNDNDSLSFTSGKFTIETWFKSNKPTATADDRHYLISKGSSGNYEYGIYMGSSGAIVGEIWTLAGSGCQSVNTAVNNNYGDNQWHHVAYVGNGSQTSLYIDGQLMVTTTQICNPGNGTSPIYFGRRPDNPSSLSWAGELDETRISNTARTPEQIKSSAQRRSYSVYTSSVIDLLGPNSGSVKQWNYLSWTGPGMSTGNGETLANTANLVAQWNLNESSGTVASVAAGSCGTSCNGTLTNFASTGSQDASPGTGWTSTNKRWGNGALMFDGADDYITINAGSQMPTGNSARTLSAWVKTNTLTGDHTVLGWGTSSSSNASYINQYLNYFRFIGWGNDLNGPANIETGKWYYVVATHDGTTTRLYVNGIQVASGAKTLNTTQTPTIIGNYQPGNSTLFNGVIDSAAIYSRALTAAEILSNYNAANIEFQTRTSADGITWEAWKGGVGDTQMDSADNTNDYWGIDTNPNSDSTAIKTGTINVGTGADGTCTVASGTVNLNTQSCAGRATADAVLFSSTVLTGVGATGITLSSTPTGLSVGSEVLIINLQGTSTNYDSVGKYEVHTISAINANSLTFADYPVKYSYDGTTQKIMVQRVPNYTNVNIGTGATMTVNTWNGSSGGVLFLKASGTVTNNGAISTNYKGYRGSPHYASASDYVYGYIGESEGALYQTTRQQTGIGTGGGSGNGQAGGGGGGYNTTGINGVNSGCVTGGAGTAGNTAGNSPLEAGLRFGGSGGAAGSHGGSGRDGAAGGASGGVISILANSFTSSGVVTSIGATGENGYKASGIAQPMGGGGGGAGGSIQIKANSVSVSGSLNVFGGTGGSSNVSDGCTPSGRGGNAGTGRISIFYTNSYTNSVSLNTTNTGTGNDGECSVPGTINLNTQSCSGRGTADAVATTSTVSTSAGSNSIVVASTSGLTAGDEVLVINLQGNSSSYDAVGQYETVTISSIVSTTIYFTTSLVNSYNGTTQKIMVQRVPNYTNVTVNAGSVLSANAWNGSTGGVIFFRAKGTINNAGTISGNGLGYRGGTGWCTYASANYGYQGESYRGLGAQTNAANAGGGGGGYCTGACASSGGGGANSGNGTAGANGTPGAGGVAYAGQTIERLLLGSGGGGSSNTNAPSCTIGNGGAGGGIVFISAANINNTGSFISNGVNGTVGTNNANGGGGAGGSIYVINNLNSFGTFTYTGGSGGLGGLGVGITMIVNPPPATSVQKNTTTIKQEGTNAIRLNSGSLQADSATIGLWHFDETNNINSPYVYGFTGNTQTYVVPAGVTSISVKAWGGGGGGGYFGGWTYGYPGGGGGYATGDIAVTPGQTFQIIVGAGGTNGSVATSVGSFGGGGQSCATSDCRYGGQGGGRSAIRYGGVDILTAGGGGGGGATYLVTNNMTGGAGGGWSGQTGFSYGFAGTGGGGGTQSSGGAGGTGTNNNGSAGSQYLGGSPLAGAYGGGGGGGWYGGGGGAYTNGNVMGGGGGGSSYASGSGVSGGSTAGGSGSVPGNPYDSYISGPNGYFGPAGTGGAAGVNGVPGKVVIFAKDSQGNIVNTITDSSEYHQTTTAGGSSIANGVVNRARDILSGSVSVNDSPSLNPTKLTIESWIKTPYTDVDLIYKIVPASPWNGYILGVGGSKPNCWVGSSGARVSGTTTVSDNKWHHVACTYDGATTRIYVDGKLENSAAQTANLTSKNNLYFFSAAFDEVRLSNVARTPEEIMESYRLGANHRVSRSIPPLNLSQNSKIPFQVAGNRLGSGLELTVGNNPFVNYDPDANTVGLWHLDEPDVGTSSAPTAFFKDSSGNSNNGTPGTGTSFPVFANGKIGRARNFSGVGGSNPTYITASSVPAITSSAFTLSLWVNPTSLTNNPIPISHGQYNTNGYYMHILAGGGINFYTNQSGANQLTTAISGSFVTNQWQLLTVVRNGSSVRIYRNGQDVTASTGTHINPATATAPFTIGTYYPSPSTYIFQGSIDEVRLDNVARSAADIRAAYEVGARSHQVVIDFKAKPDSSGIGVTATSFNLDETPFGAATKLPHLFSGNKLIVQENVGGTEFLAQGLVSTANVSSGAVTMSNWDVGSSFPVGGFTTNATVFKWQQEFFDLKGALPEQRNNISRLTLRLTDEASGGSYWLDDFRTVGSLLNISTGSSIASTFNRYFQYRAIESTSDNNVSASIQGVSFDYLRNYTPGTPTLVMPSNGSTNLQAVVSLGTSAFDIESDYLQYRIKVCTNAAMTVGCQTFDQTSSQTGWSGQDAQSNTAYNTGTLATLTTTLSYNTTYYWQSWAIDPAGSGLWSGTQVTPWSFTTSYTPVTPSLLFPADNSVDQRYTLSLGTSSSDPDGDPLQYRINLCRDAAMTIDCQTFDQTISQVGWTGQDVGGIYYSTGTSASYTVTNLDANSTYYWKSVATDPTGSHLWSSTQATPFKFTTAVIPVSPINCIIEEAVDDSFLKLKWNGRTTLIDGYSIEKNVDNAGFTPLTIAYGVGITDYSDSNVPENHTYQYRVAATFSGRNSPWCLSPLLDLGGTLPAPTPTLPGPTPTGVLPTSIPENGILIY